MKQNTLEAKINIIENGLHMKLYTYRWDALPATTKPKGAIFLLHGINAHCQYEFLANDGQKEAETQWLDFFVKNIKGDTSISSETSFSETTEEMYKTLGIKHFHLNLNGKMQFFPEEVPSLSAAYEKHSNIEATLSNLLPSKTTVDNKYHLEGSWIELLRNEGFLLYGIDHQSHGFSEGWTGRRSTFPSFQVVCDDILSELIKIRQDLNKEFGDTKVPLFLMGASFGGALTTRCSQIISESAELSQKIQLSGCILLAPALQVNESTLNKLKKMLLPLSSFVSLILPHLRISQEITHPDFEYLNSYFKNDPLTNKEILSIRPVAEILSTAKIIQQNASKITPHISYLICHSVRDGLCDVNGSKSFYENCSSQDKQLWLLHCMWHMVTKEPGSTDLCHHILQWLNARVKDN